MVDLIRDERRRGYPTEYLVARLRARQARLLADWYAAAASGIPTGLTDERIWGAFLREVEWLHRQMNPPVRRAAAPMFGLFELKTIALCVRNGGTGRTAEAERMLAHSLLAPAVKTALLESGDTRSTVAAVAAILARTAAAFRGLSTTYEHGNLRSVENALMRLYLEDAAAARLVAPIRSFFGAFIDARNLMILYKALRWGLRSEGPFISGGHVDRARLGDILIRKDAARLDRLVAFATGVDASAMAASEPVLETLLLRTMTRTLDIARRGAGIGPIVGYLWRCYIQARNLAVLYHCRDLDAQTLAQELIA